MIEHLVQSTGPVPSQTINCSYILAKILYQDVYGKTCNGRFPLVDSRPCMHGGLAIHQPKEEFKLDKQSACYFALQINLHPILLVSF